MNASNDTRTILHADMDAFFTSVEQHDHPEYRGKPVVVGSPPTQRGVISAASYEAREYGVYSAMPSVKAGRLCPHAIFCPVNMKRYREVSGQIFEIFTRFTPYVEPLSVDEAFLDVSGVLHLLGTGVEIAEKLRAAVREETGLTISVGVAGNKFLAKLASDMNKPDGLTVVPTDATAIQAFLAPLPIGKIWGVGKVMRKRLQSNGMHTIGDVQQCSLQQLMRLLGENSALRLRALVFGRDERGLELEHQEKSISREYTFGVDCEDAAEIAHVLRELAADVGRRLRQKKKYAGGVQIKWRGSDFRTITRQRKLTEVVRDDFRIAEVARELYEELKPSGPVRLVGVGVYALCEQQVRQLELFDDGGGDDKKNRISEVMDQIRDMYGDDCIGRL